MRTDYDRERSAFTQAAHTAAAKQFYPFMFPDAVVEFTPTTNTILDLDYGIDCQMEVTHPDFRRPIRFSVQERFREPGALQWGEITITEWNCATYQPSELYKLDAQLFVYGYYYQRGDAIISATVFNVATIQAGLLTDRIPFIRKFNEKQQMYLAVDYAGLKTVGAIMFDRDCISRAMAS